MKRLYQIIPFILIITLCLVLTGCNKKSQLSFNTNGGNDISSISLDSKESYNLPTPTKEGYEFIGWYLNSDFSGEMITSITIKSDTTVYAKWEQLYKITLDLDGGNLSTTSIYAKNGDNIYSLVKDLVPTKAGTVFGAWFNGNQELSESTKINKDITLTARYKIEYTVNLYKQNLSLDGYDKEELKKYAYIGSKASYNSDDVIGFTEVTKEDTIDEITVSTSNNVLNLYFDRDEYTITFRSNYPDSSLPEESESITILYGEEVDLPDYDFKINGYYLLGYALSADSDIIYNAHYIDNLPVNLEEEIEVTKDKVTAFRTMSLYAIWNKGYRDMFGGSDYIFIAPDKETCYLSREGVYFVGEYYDDDKSFILYNDKENLEGRIYSDLTFAYYNVTRDEYSATLYTVGAGLDEKIKIFLDPYNGITYYDENEEPTNRESKGTYTIDSDGFYHVTFTTGVKAGEEMIITTGRVSAEGIYTDAFQLRRDEEVELGELVRFTVNNSTLTYYTNAYQIKLSGFGTLTYNNGNSTETFYYSMDDETKILTINRQNGSSFGKVKLMTNDGVNGYMFYDENLDHEFEGENGSKLTLDGVLNAEYVSGDTSVNGVYEIKQSAFGGYIVIFKNNGTTYTFLTKSETEESIASGENEETETVTTYSFVTKPNGYSEYYYKNETSIYYAPLVVLNDKEEGKASVYGYTTNRTYELVLEGTYEYDSNTNLYVFTTTEVHDKKVLTNPHDIKTLTSFIFAADDKMTNYSISYWYSSTKGEEVTDYKKEIKNSDNSSLLLVSGVAILSKDGYVITGTYQVRDNLTIISNNNGSIYLEVYEDSFIVLDHAPYNAYYVLEDASYSTRTHVTFDGKGNAKYVYTENVEGEDKEFTIEGVISKTDEKTRQGEEIYLFTSNDKTFKYLLKHLNNGSFVLPLYDEYMGSYQSNDGILYLDGYLNYISYTDTLGNELTGTYAIDGTNVIKANFDSTIRYFDIDSKSFTVRGIEYGTYIVIENQGSNGVYADLDGYGKALVYTVDGETKTTVDENATYTIENNKYTLKYVDGAKDITLVGYIDKYKENNELVDAFIIEKTDAIHTYINSRDWSILKLDSKGHAVRVDNKGNKDEGTYTIITDSLLYYENTDASYANIYKYNSSKGTIVESRFVPRGYYTKELKSLLFSQYGFAVFNFETKYFYNVEGQEVMIYRQDLNDPNANEYGFIQENFGEFTDIKEYNGDTYYQNDGFAINFSRKEETKELYPVLVSVANNLRKPTENLSFSPTGNDEFRSSGTVTVNGMPLNCTVVREYVDDHYEMYFLVGYYRFDITVEYNGKSEDGSSTSTYEVVGMSCIRRYDPYRYLNNYYMYYLFYGQQFVSTYENNIGVITIMQMFDQEGNMTEDYVNVEFGEETNAFDLNDKSLSGNNLKYTYSDETEQFEVNIEGTDGYTYKLYFLVRTHPAFNANSYVLYALTRVETLKYNDYEVTIERVLLTDYNVQPGAYFKVSMKYQEEELNSTESFEIENVLHFISRTFDEEKSLTSTTYYKLDLVTKESESLKEGVIAPYESVEVSTVDTIKTYFDKDTNSYVDVKDGKVIFASINGTKYLITESTFDESTNTYHIILNNLEEYDIVVENETSASITKLESEEETDGQE